MQVTVKTNEVTNLEEAFIPGTLRTLPSKFLMNSKGTEYGIAEVDVVNPQTGEITTVRGMIYKNQFVDKSTGLDNGLYQPGSSVELAVQTSGEYAGNAKVQLPSGRGVSDDLLAAFGIATKPAEAGIFATE